MTPAGPVPRLAACLPLETGGSSLPGAIGLRQAHARDDPLGRVIELEETAGLGPG
jgi:hypothetical protein